MLTDEDARQLMQMAADTIDVSANTAPLTPPRRTWSIAAVAASVALVLVGGGLVAYGLAAGGGRGSDVAATPERSVRVGAVVVGYLPNGWTATTQPHADVAAHSCVGPDSEPCAVHVLAASTPARDSGIPWFSFLTEPCLSDTSTTVLTDTTEFPAGPGETANLRCAGPEGTVRNTAWVLDVGVAVIPSAAENIDQGLRVMNGLRFASGTPSPPSLTPSEQPSSASTATDSSTSPVVLLQWPSNSAAPEGRNPLIGRLKVDGTCLVVDLVSTDYNVVWPSGFSVTHDAAGVHLYDAAGQLVGNEGDTIETSVALSNEPADVGSCQLSGGRPLADSPFATVTDTVKLHTPPTDFPDNWAIDERFIQGTWETRIAGVIGTDGKEQYDTYRDIPMTITLDGGQVDANDGCNTYRGTYQLTAGLDGTSLELTINDLTAQTDNDCPRVPPLISLLDQIRAASRVDGNLYFLNNGIVLALHK
jgi:hypothetical protein